MPMFSTWKNCGKQHKNARFFLNPTPILHLNDVILHPILHPKYIENKGDFQEECRKCRFFSETFFVGIAGSV